MEKENEKCDCMTTGPDPEWHRHGCPVRKGVQFPRLFYYEDAVDAWIPAPDDIESIISVEDQLCEHGDTIEIQFKRYDMTDSQIDNLPEE